MTRPADAGEFVSGRLEFDGGRGITAWVPSRPPGAVVFCGDGQLVPTWAAAVREAGAPPPLIVGLHRVADETLRLHEYSPRFDPDRFAAHEAAFTDGLRDWVRDRLGVETPRDRTAIFGVSAGGELALALGLRRPDLYGAIFCASPGGGYRPAEALPPPLPRTYLTAGLQEPFFLQNAARWAEALRRSGADVEMTERQGGHGDAFWRTEFPLMLAWAFDD